VAVVDEPLVLRRHPVNRVRHPHSQSLATYRSSFVNT
jgi:hypothetical protein